jgi:kinesin family protein 4/21/27
MDSLMEGLNVTVIAYGQTGSGKTHTMGNGVLDQTTEVAGFSSSPRQLIRQNSRRNSIFSMPKQQPYKMKDTDGLIPRFLYDFFHRLKDQKESIQTKIDVSFLEIYGEELHDLLISSQASQGDNERSNLTIREDNHNVWVEGLREIPVTTCEEALYQMQLGRRHQITRSNGIHDNSSRSHAVFTVKIKRQTSLDRATSLSRETVVSHGEIVHLPVSKITFVDLAGSERLKKNHAEGNTSKKTGTQINGKFVLSTVLHVCKRFYF